MQIIRATQNKIVVYYTSLGQSEKLKNREKGKKLTEDNRTKGVLSQKAKARMKNCISKLVGAYTVGQYANAWKFFTRRLSLNFVTLTLPSKQVHSDKEIKRTSLAAFLQTLQKKFGVTSYVWRAEKQANNNIHFHILINRNVHWAAIRQEWNRCIELLGYVSAYKEKFSRFTLAEYIRFRNPKNSEENAKVIKAFNKAVSEGWSNPNSTDIHRIEKMHKIEAYVAKYMTKDSEENTLTVEGHLWGRSDNLEALADFETVPGPKDLKKLEQIRDTSHCMYYRDEYFEVYTLLDIDIFDLSFSFTAKFIAQMQNNYCYLERIVNSVQKVSIV